MWGLRRCKTQCNEALGVSLWENDLNKICKKKSTKMSVIEWQFMAWHIAVWNLSVPSREAAFASYTSFCCFINVTFKALILYIGTEASMRRQNILKGPLWVRSMTSPIFHLLPTINPFALPDNFQNQVDINKTNCQETWQFCLGKPGVLRECQGKDLAARFLR